jgi:Bacterial dnaA protein helix-turn-helix
MGQTASYFGLSIEDLCGTSRSRVLVTARHNTQYLLGELTDLSKPEINLLPRPVSMRWPRWLGTAMRSARWTAIRAGITSCPR